MTPRMWKSFWAITGLSENVEFLEPYRTGLPYEDAIQINTGELTASRPGYYRTFDTEEDLPGNPGRFRAIGGMNGPIYVDSIGLETYLVNLETRIGAIINDLVPDEDESRLIWLDPEDWQPYWRRDKRENPPYDHPAAPGIDAVPNCLEVVWRRYLAETLGEPEVVDYSSATGAEREEMEDHFENRYIALARPVHDTIYSTIRALRPDAKVGEYGWPSVPLYNAIPTTGPYPFMKLANDRYVPRMMRNWDCLLPSLYPGHQAVLGEPSEMYEITGAEWTNLYTHTAVEFARVKSICGAPPMFWFLNPEFTGTGPVGVPMNSLTARLQVGLPRLHNADGIFMFGHMSDHSEETRARVLSGLVPMQRRLANFRASLDGAILTINSPIALGPI